MTVVPSTGGGEVEQYTGEVVGLDDVDASDVIIPRLQIKHDEGVFVDNLSKQVFTELDCVILGLVKQRIFWADEVEEGDKPLCKSPDHDHGFPQISDDVKKDKRFPWDKSNFDPANFPADGPNAVNGLVTLPCASCHFKEWDNNGFNQKVPPCAEQHTYPLLYNTNTENPNEPIWAAAILTVQKTGIAPSKRYISSFQQSNQPMFTARSLVTLTLNKRGTVTYSVPGFRKTGQTDSSMWGQYSEQYRQIRAFCRTPPRNTDADPYAEAEGGFASDNTNTPAPAAAAPSQPAAAAEPQVASPAPSQAAAPPAAPVPASPPDDPDGLPF